MNRTSCPSCDTTGHGVVTAWLRCHHLPPRALHPNPPRAARAHRACVRPQSGRGTGASRGEEGDALRRRRRGRRGGGRRRGRRGEVGAEAKRKPTRCASARHGRASLAAQRSSAKCRSTSPCPPARRASPPGAPDRRARAEQVRRGGPRRHLDRLRRAVWRPLGGAGGGGGGATAEVPFVRYLDPRLLHLLVGESPENGRSACLAAIGELELFWIEARGQCDVDVAEAREFLSPQDLCIPRKTLQNDSAE